MVLQKEILKKYFEHKSFFFTFLLDVIFIDLYIWYANPSDYHFFKCQPD
tara:strand:- start:2344 stop:2490 length:147 start_codon:yes stop_codon:yes gene_type:complete